MLFIQFTVLPLTDEVHEYDQGHIELSVDSKTFISSGTPLNKSMMIFIAASDLLSGVVNLYRRKHIKAYEFVGADSSFRVVFIRKQKNQVALYYDDRKLCDMNLTSLLQSVYDAVFSLHAKYGERMLGSGAAKEDLEYALASASKLLSLEKF